MKREKVQFIRCLTGDSDRDRLPRVPGRFTGGERAREHPLGDG